MIPVIVLPQADRLPQDFACDYRSQETIPIGEHALQTLRFPPWIRLRRLRLRRSDHGYEPAAGGADSGGGAGEEPLSAAPTLLEIAPRISESA